MKIGQIGFMYPMIKASAKSEPFSPLTFMNRLSVLSANSESTVNDVLGHARKITIFKFKTVIRYGDNNAYLS